MSNTIKHDLYNDMENTPWFVTKVCDSKTYAQNLYAALCNMQWQKSDVIPILTDELWSISWRGAGGLVAELRNCGEDYLDFYCSGISGGMDINDPLNDGHVGEGIVTDEIKYDLGLLGWHPVPWPKDD